MQYTGLLIAAIVALAAALATGEVLARLGFPIPDASKRIGCVDGLRGYLALLVMMHHFDLWTNMSVYGMPWGDSSSQLVRNFGPGGVTLFFMATGLVFYPRIERGWRAVDWRTTYLSRVFRILPLQLVMVAVAAVISLAMATTGTGGIRTNAVALLDWITSHSEPALFGYEKAGSINAYVLWSLWYEWLFYLFVLPLLAWLHDRLGSRLPPLAIPLGAVILGAVVGPFANHPLLAIIIFLPLFAFGMTAYVLRRYAGVRRWLASPPAAVIAVIALAVVMIWGGNPFGLPQLAGYALFFCCIAAGNSFAGLFTMRGSIVLGELSFGIYLIHGTVLYLLFTFPVTPDMSLPLLYAALPFAAIVAVLISAAAHLAIERPGIALGRRLSGKPRRPVAPAIEREAANMAS